MSYSEYLKSRQARDNQAQESMQTRDEAPPVPAPPPPPPLPSLMDTPWSLTRDEAAPVPAPLPPPPPPLFAVPADILELELPDPPLPPCAAGDQKVGFTGRSPGPVTVMQLDQVGLSPVLVDVVMLVVVVVVLVSCGV